MSTPSRKPSETPETPGFPAHVVVDDAGMPVSTGSSGKDTMLVFDRAHPGGEAVDLIVTTPGLDGDETGFVIEVEYHFDPQISDVEAVTHLPFETSKVLMTRGDFEIGSNEASGPKFGIADEGTQRRAFDRTTLNALRSLGLPTSDRPGR